MSDSAQDGARFATATALQDSQGFGNADLVELPAHSVANWSDTTTTLPAVTDGDAPDTAAVRGPKTAAPETATPKSAEPKAAAPQAAVPKVAKVPKRPERGPRRAKLQVRHLNIWSVLKFSCVLALALFLVWLIVIAVLYGTLDQMHVFSKINETVQKINGDKVEQNYVSRNVVFGAALIIGLVNTVLFIVLSTIGAIVYNLCADLVGGIEVTLSEREH